jgi:hypothetical protein
LSSNTDLDWWKLSKTPIRRAFADVVPTKGKQY